MGVIEIITGYLLRAGFCDFTTDGSFDTETEQQHAGVPEPFLLKADGAEFITRWDGTGWDLALRN